MREVKVKTQPGMPVIMVPTHWGYEEVDEEIRRRFGLQTSFEPHDWETGWMQRKAFVLIKFLRDDSGMAGYVVGRVFQFYGLDGLTLLENADFRGQKLVTEYRRCGNSVAAMIRKLKRTNGTE